MRVLLSKIITDSTTITTITTTTAATVHNNRLGLANTNLFINESLVIKKNVLRTKVKLNAPCLNLYTF